GGGQQLLNALLFVPAGFLMTVAFARWRAGWVLVPLGFVLLAVYSLGIEETQLQVARIDRACDVTDIIDNVTGAAAGVVLALVLLPAVRPWRARSRRRAGIGCPHAGPAAARVRVPDPGVRRGKAAAAASGPDDVQAVVQRE